MLRLLTALLLVRKLPFLTAFLIGLALLLPIFFLLAGLAHWFAPLPVRQHRSSSKIDRWYAIELLTARPPRENPAAEGEL